MKPYRKKRNSQYFKKPTPEYVHRPKTAFNLLQIFRSPILINGSIDPKDLEDLHPGKVIRVRRDR